MKRPRNLVKKELRAYELLEHLGYRWLDGEWVKDYRSVNVHIPPEHRAPGSKGSTQK